MCASDLLYSLLSVLGSAFGWDYNMVKFNDGLKKLKEQCKMINTHLANKEWLACDRMTLADLAMFPLLANGFSTVLDAGFR
jgi:glutathione S-transferase